MTAIDTIFNICNNEKLFNENLKYCLVDRNKLPHKANGEMAKPNNVDDFVELTTLLEKCNNLEDYAGIGMSIQANNICAIDVDHCFSNPFDVSSADKRANDIIELFKSCAYIEFSFSGKGMRVLFKNNVIENYSQKYYIKNDKQGIEYYQPSSSYRYVTITGQVIADNAITNISKVVLIQFLDEYMLRPVIFRKDYEVTNDDRPIEELLKIVKQLYFKNMTFQDLWFMTEDEHIRVLNCNISGKSKESHADYQLLSLLFENVTQDKLKLRQVFEQSPYYKSKDYKHMQKWTKSDYRYYDYQYNNIKALHSK